MCYCKKMCKSLSMYPLFDVTGLCAIKLTTRRYKSPQVTNKPENVIIFYIGNLLTSSGKMKFLLLSQS